MQGHPPLLQMLSKLMLARRSTSDMAEETEPEEEKKMLTKEEYLQLDDDAFFDAYAEGRIPRRGDAFTSENILEEIEKIPLFMTKQPEDKEWVTNPMLDGLLQIAHELTTPKDRAQRQKDHGNELFTKAKKLDIPRARAFEFHKAVKAYTEGILEACEDAQLNSVLHSNRAAVHLLLENYGQVKKDCRDAVKFDPTNIKAYWRHACANVALEQYEECIEWCDMGLAKEPANKSLAEERQKAVLGKAAKQKKERMEAAKQRKLKEAQDALIKASETRGIKMAASRPKPAYETAEEEVLPEANASSGPKSDQNGRLLWPVLFVYPEAGQTDMIEAFNEDNTFDEHFTIMFPDEPTPAVAWDVENKYKRKNLNVYFEYIDPATLKPSMIKCKRSDTLLSTMQHKQYVVYGGSPWFVVLVDGSEFERTFLAKYKKQ